MVVTPMIIISGSYKKQVMKLPKSLLSAIVVGIVVQAVSSCEKSKDDLNSKVKQEILKKETEKATSYPESCPACGMG